jgi:hypothetical protein
MSDVGEIFEADNDILVVNPDGSGETQLTKA